MEENTMLGEGFPATRHSLIEGLRSDDVLERRRNLDALLAAYWKPVYKHVRLRHSRAHEDAKDLTQSFFLRALEKDFFAAYDPAKARFRTFLRVCLDRYLANEEKAARAQKRGGDAIVLSLDFDAALRELGSLAASADLDAERAFHAEWLRSLFGIALDALRAEAAARGREVSFQLFERYELGDEPGERPTYAQMGNEFALATSAVTNHLAWARREFRRVLLRELRRITTSDAEYRAEAREILGEEVD